MALKVLLADDNITAQRMGSKILSDAGYTVVAVSNGAAAVKKIASEHPDLLILDVFMPGYSGLEVCEKIKNASATARVPVLLTVTNMEPYSAADGNRVKADGVLIKPFEATDLLAVMHKYEEQLQALEYLTQKTERVEEAEEAEPAVAEMEVRRAEMPQELAMAPALGIEHLGAAPAAEAASAFAAASTFAAEAPAVEEAAPSDAAPAEETAPTFEAQPVAEAAPANEEPAGVEILRPLEALEAAMPRFDSSFDSNPPVETAFAPAVELVPEPAAEAEWAPEIAPPAELEFNAAPPVQIEVAPAEEVEFNAAPPVPIEVAQAEEVEFNAAPPVPIEVAPAEDLEPTAQPASGIAVVQETALATRPEDFSEFTTRFGAEHAEDIPIGIAMEDGSEAEALEAIPGLLGEPTTLQEEQSAGVPEEEMRRAVEHFDVREPAVEAEPELEPEYDTQRIHAVVEEPEPEMRHVPAMAEPSEQEIHEVPVMAEAPEQGVQPDTTMLAESEALHRIASSFEEQPAVHEVSGTVEQQVVATVEQAEPEMRPVWAAGEEPEHATLETAAMVEEAEAAPVELEAPIGEPAEIPPVLVTRFAEELERVQAEAVAETAGLAPEMEPPAEAARAPMSSLSEDRVADAVHRVLDRYKGELIAAIVKELRS